MLWRGAARVGHFVLFRFCARAGSQQLSHRDALLKNLEGIKASDAGHRHHVRVLSVQVTCFCRGVLAAGGS